VTLVHFFHKNPLQKVPLDFYVANWRNLSLKICRQSHQTEQSITNAIPQHSMLLNELDWHLHIYLLHNKNNFFSTSYKIDTVFFSDCYILLYNVLQS
jgi:hypothetical protein